MNTEAPANNLVSIIVPAYQAQNTIRRCLNSLLVQTYHNIEILVIDDGSNDDTSETIRDIGKLDNRILYFHQNNGGIGSARNLGLAHAQGRYVGFVDSDDYVSPFYISSMVSAIENHDCADMVICGYATVFPDYGFQLIESPLDGTFSGEDILIRMLRSYDSSRFLVCWNKLFRRDLLTGIPFPESSYGEDARLVEQYYLQCREIVCIHDVLYRYMHTDQGITRSSKVGTYYPKDLSMNLGRLRSAMSDKRYAPALGTLFMRTLDSYVLAQSKTSEKMNDTAIFQDIIPELHQRLSIYARACLKFAFSSPGLYGAWLIIKRRMRKMKKISYIRRLPNPKTDTAFPDKSAIK